MEEEKLSVFLAIPTMGDISIQFMESIVKMILETKRKYPSCEFEIVSCIRKMHHRARTELAEKFLESSCTHILWVDDDNIPGENDLITLLEDNLPLVSGIYFRREYPHNPVIIMTKQDGIGSEIRPDLYDPVNRPIIDVFAVGMGFMLIQREAMEKIKGVGASMFDVRGNVGEDVWFCAQAHVAGIAVKIDQKVEVGHLGDRKMIKGESFLIG